MLTQERLKELLSYNPESGEFFWLVDRNGGAYAGDLAGTTMNKGYLHIKIDGSLYLGHRLAWLYMTGEMPKKQIDHINNIRIDNRWVNLRETNAAGNSKNASIRADNKSGFKGVGFHSPTGKWRARIRVDGCRRSLGLFDTPELAYAAYKAAAKKMHGEFANFG